MRIQFLLLYFTITISSLAPENPGHLIWLEEQREIQIEREKIEQKKEKRIINLLAALRIIESNNNYKAHGASGEYGAYQFMPETWCLYCYKFFGKELDIMLPANQDKIARLKIEHLVKKGYTNSEIAAIWNSGRIKDWEEKIGINQYGVRYDVPAYVEKFTNLLRYHSIDYESETDS